MPNNTAKTGLNCIELCAGAGGQAIGLEQAGWEHSALLELDAHACRTLKLNRPEWNVIRADIKNFSFGRSVRGSVDLVAAGLPCPPFSIAGKQLGEDDERNLFPAAVRLIDEIRPKAVMIENVRGLMDAVFVDFRLFVDQQLKKLGYAPQWKLMQASEFGVPQLRPRVVFVAVKKEFKSEFRWPEGELQSARPTVGKCLKDLMATNGWKGAQIWSERANEIAPTVVGGSHKHGGPDLGPTRARAAWATLGVDGLGIADAPPGPDFVGMPKLTVRMVARIQGFPDEWEFSGKKTAAYRQVGNAFPPPFAKAVSEQVRKCLTKSRLFKVSA
jgi:DNA (cytosine-5)-methyltransferase 1